MEFLVLVQALELKQRAETKIKRQCAHGIPTQGFLA